MKYCKDCKRIHDGNFNCAWEQNIPKPNQLHQMEYETLDGEIHLLTDNEEEEKKKARIRKVDEGVFARHYFDHQKAVDEEEKKKARIRKVDEGVFARHYFDHQKAVDEEEEPGDDDSTELDFCDDSETESECATREKNLIEWKTKNEFNGKINKIDEWLHGMHSMTNLIDECSSNFPGQKPTMLKVYEETLKELKNATATIRIIQSMDEV